MARRPQPWYRTARKSWFVTIDGVQHDLGADKDRAYDKFYELMRKPRKRRVASELLVAICDIYLDWLMHHRSAATFEWYRSRLQKFITLHPDLRVADLKPFHVQQWVDSHAGHSAATKRNNIRAVKRCLTWATQQGYIDANPILHLPAPTADRRDMVVDPDQFVTLLPFVTSEPFRDLLIVTYDTGCRPQESLRVEARHVELDRSRWVFATAESKTQQMPRVVYLSERAVAITARLVAVYVKTLATHQTVKGVRREKSRADLLCEARRKLTQRRSRDFAPRYSLYTLRHSWANNALVRGVDSLTVAILMGHRDPSTLARVYQHLSHRPDHLLAEARRACGLIRRCLSCVRLAIVPSSH